MGKHSHKQTVCRKAVQTGGLRWHGPFDVEIDCVATV
jgi:hypothetical protein